MASLKSNSPLDDPMLLITRGAASPWTVPLPDSMAEDVASTFWTITGLDGIMLISWIDSNDESLPGAVELGKLANMGPNWFGILLPPLNPSPCAVPAFGTIAELAVLKGFEWESCSDATAWTGPKRLLFGTSAFFEKRLTSKPVMEDASIANRTRHPARGSTINDQCQF